MLPTSLAIDIDWLLQTTRRFPFENLQLPADISLACSNERKFVAMMLSGGLDFEHLITHGIYIQNGAIVNFKLFRRAQLGWCGKKGRTGGGNDVDHRLRNFLSLTIHSNHEI